MFLMGARNCILCLFAEPHSFASVLYPNILFIVYLDFLMKGVLFC